MAEKFTLKEIKEAESALNEVFTLSLPIKASFKLSKIIKAVKPELINYNEHYNKIIKEHGVPSKDNPNNIIVPKEKEEEVLGYIKELLDTEVEISFVPIKLDELDNVSISPKILIDLNRFVVE